MSSYRRQWIMVGAAIIAALFFAMILMPITAQDSLPTFATNTPQSSTASAPLDFATNTPQPTTTILTVPDAPINRYALRVWDEASLENVLLNEVQGLHVGDGDRAIGIRLLQNELQHRFPGAPHDPAVRGKILRAMLQAPPGTVDMRFVVLPVIQDALNQAKPSFTTPSTIEDSGFSIAISPTHLKSTSSPDAVLLIQYPSTADTPLFKVYAMASINQQGQYQVFAADYPSVPFDGYTTLNLEQLGDLNGDGLDEMAVSIDRPGDANAKLVILGWRGSGVVNLTQPGQTISFQGGIQWDDSSHALTVQEFREDSPAWQCYSTRQITWSWTLNFFRPTAQPDAFVPQNRLACMLSGVEPLYEMPLSEAINSIEQVAPFATSDDQYAAQRASMMVVMMRVLSGDIAQALDQVKQLQATAQPGSWLDKQTSAFVQAASQSGITPLQLCATLQDASLYGACDVNQVLARLFKEQPLRLDQPIEAQVAQWGLSVLDQTTLSQVGRLDRQAVHFNLAGNQWWAFAPLGNGVYTAEEIDTPAGYEPARAPSLLITPPQKAYDALLLNNDAREVLNILDNAVHDNPGAKLDGSAWFLKALSYDLLGDRTNARQSYFDLWATESESVWGQLAAAHLEHR